MAAQSIKNDLGKFLINLAIDRVDKWAWKELNVIRHSGDIPLCIPMSPNSWAVGSYEIVARGPVSFSVKQTDELIYTFYSKQAAIFYCVFSRLHYYKMADKLLSSDQKVSKYYNDSEFYNKKLKSRKIIKDEFKHQLYYSRYLESKSLLNLSLSDLEKTLNLAKYYKIWDKIL
jgi:hypothetical protein